MSGSVLFFLICNYKEKGGGRVNTREGMYLAWSQRKIGVKCSIRVRGRKANLQTFRVSSG